jgi:PAS domain S-box-containing protein
VAVLFNDITKRKMIEEKLRTQAMMLRQVHDSVFAVDNAYRITYINKATKKQFELSGVSDFIGSKLGDYISFEWLDERQQKESAKALREKGVWQGENLYSTATGKMFWGDSVISVTKDASGRKNGVVTVVRDISARKHMEKQLLEKNEHLTKVNELLDDFVHIAAHDLRGPIASIMMMSELISLKKRTEDKELVFSELIPIVNKLHRTVIGLMETVNIQTETAASFKKNVFVDIYNEIIEECSIELGRYRVKIETDFNKAPDIDYVEAYLKSIMKNLITNALKYSADMENPHINVSTVREKEFVLLTIKDNGIGIDLEKAGENLFKPFKRFTSKAEGTGMGLYIIKNIIEKNGGYIDVKSKLNEGTTFCCFMKEYTIDM